MKAFLAFLAAAALAVLPVRDASAKPIKIKLATLAPDGSPWHELLKDLQANWARVSDGQIDLRIYAGGVAGDEPVVMKKMGINNYNAALISSHGLSSISTDTRVFTIPRMLKDNEELDRAMEIMAPEMEPKLEAKGYVVLAWADAGWVKFFVPTPDASIDAIRNHKLFTWAGDSEGMELWKAAGFNVVPLPATELITGLQTKLINAFDTMPYYALASQAYRHADYMIDMKWAPLPGALVITKATWDKIPENIKPALRAEADKFARRFRDETRKMDEEAVQAMQERGVKVVTPTAAELREWDKEAEVIYPKVRGGYVSAEIFDRYTEVIRQIRKNPR